LFKSFFVPDEEKEVTARKFIPADGGTARDCTPARLRPGIPPGYIVDVGTLPVVH
jgi:hypothetical protein